MHQKHSSSKTAKGKKVRDTFHTFTFDQPINILIPLPWWCSRKKTHFSLYNDSCNNPECRNFWNSSMSKFTWLEKLTLFTTSDDLISAVIIPIAGTLLPSHTHPVVSIFANVVLMWYVNVQTGIKN